MQRFFVGRQDTSHLHDYPSTGISKQMMSPSAGVIQSHFESVIVRNLRRHRSRAIMLCAGCYSTSATSTRRNSGGDHVPYCTPPDAVEPARRRVSNPAGRAGSHRFNNN
jgi:hypothetical protein